MIDNPPTEGPEESKPRSPTFTRLMATGPTGIVLTALFLITLLAITYAFENWRGRRAWELCKAEFRAKNEPVDWSALLPKQIPDDQNMMHVPGMNNRFVKGTKPGKQPPELMMTNAIGWEAFVETRKKENPIQAAQIKVTLTGKREGEAAGKAPVSWEDFREKKEEIVRLITKGLGGGCNTPQGYVLIGKEPRQVTPVVLQIEAKKALTPGELKTWINSSKEAGSLTSFVVAPGEDEGQLNVSLESGGAFPAQEYLEWSDQFIPKFDYIHAAAQRPFIHLEGDYSSPIVTPIPNFVEIRGLCQLYGARAQACLLLREPEKALNELLRLKDLTRILEARPVTLVAAMINVAVHGLCVGVIQDGFRTQVWKNEQWTKIQDYLQTIDLLSPIRAAMWAERLGMCDTFEKISAADLKAALGNTGLDWKDPVYLFIKLCPKGWVYQNMKTVARLVGPFGEEIDTANHFVNPLLLAQSSEQVEKELNKMSPYVFLARIAVPNFSKAGQTLAKNQTLIDEGIIACALERYRSAQGHYPGNLSMLSPDFLNKIPLQLVNRESFKYFHTREPRPLLYSVGWDLKDDLAEDLKKFIKDAGASEISQLPDLAAFINKDWIWMGLPPPSENQNNPQKTVQQ